MASRHLVHVDGSIVVLESSRFYRLEGVGRTLPHSRRRARNPLELQMCLCEQERRREQRAAASADRKTMALISLAIGGLLLLFAKENPEVATILISLAAVLGSLLLFLMRGGRQEGPAIPEQTDGQELQAESEPNAFFGMVFYDRNIPVPLMNSEWQRVQAQAAVEEMSALQWGRKAILAQLGQAEREARQRELPEAEREAEVEVHR